MSRLFLAAVVVSIFSSNVVAQSPAPALPAGKTPEPQGKPPALPAPSPSVTPTLEELIDSLGPADLQAFITLLKGNFTGSAAAAAARHRSFAWKRKRHRRCAWPVLQ